MALSVTQQLIKFYQVPITTQIRYKHQKQSSQCICVGNTNLLQPKPLYPIFVVLSNLFAVSLLVYALTTILPHRGKNEQPLQWLNPDILNEFQTTFYRLLDHNNDGIVNITELSIGIQSQIDTSSIQRGNIYRYISFIPEQYTCIPSIDFIDFADCSVIKARKGLISSSTVSFDELLNAYFAECRDIVPPNKIFENKHCDELISHNPFLCNEYPSYCQLSCYQCNEHMDDVLRGTNNQFIERPENPMTRATDLHISSTSNGKNIVFVSDIHVEPWYNVEYHGHARISRFKGANSTNMFQCRNTENIQVPCTLNGKSDSPFSLYSAAMNFLDHLSNVDVTKSILIFGGDTQAHQYEKYVSSPLTDTVPGLLSVVIEYMLRYFEPKHIFYTAGNHDGNNNELFCSGSDRRVNDEWANVLIDNQIVNNDLQRKYAVNGSNYDQITFFKETGYYIKKIPNIFETKNMMNQYFYAIILNTNLGVTNLRQNKAFYSDLKWIKNQKDGGCLVIGHHPNIVQSIIPSKYDDIIKGSFSGHVHYFQPSNKRLFAILPSTTQNAPYVGVVTGGLNDDNNVVLSWDDLYQYSAKKNKVPNDISWVYDKKTRTQYL